MNIYGIWMVEQWNKFSWLYAYWLECVVNSCEFKLSLTCTFHLQNSGETLQT